MIIARDTAVHGTKEHSRLSKTQRPRLRHSFVRHVVRRDVVAVSLDKAEISFYKRRIK